MTLKTFLYRICNGNIIQLAGKSLSIYITDTCQTLVAIYKAKFSGRITLSIHFCLNQNIRPLALRRSPFYLVYCFTHVVVQHMHIAEMEQDLTVSNNKSIYLLAIYIKTCIPKHEHKFDMNI